jgi:hypothetical protein
VKTLLLFFLVSAAFAAEPKITYVKHIYFEPEFETGQVVKAYKNERSNNFVYGKIVNIRMIYYQSNQSKKYEYLIWGSWIKEKRIEKMEVSK